ncbi:MAG TPA: DUF1259 domain-containing protein [Candidatus Brocadiaceae bacterium]
MKSIMKCSIMAILFILSFLCIRMVSGEKPIYAADDFGEVEKILGSTGQVQEGSLIVRFPRSDLKITINGESMPTALGFTSWTAWNTMGKEMMVMGDFVLLENEINTVISTLAEADISITALHNHFVGEQPRVMFMHIHGMGDAKSLAQGIRNALDKTATPKSGQKQAGVPQPALSLDTKRIEEIIGHTGQAGGGVYKITIGRPGVKSDGIEVTSSMGLNTWAAFIGTNEHAHVAGDVAMTDREVDNVIRALRKGGIDVVAVHNHMLDEEPRIFFLHYWGTGTVEKLAQTLRAAFNQAKGPVQ